MKIPGIIRPVYTVKSTKEFPGFSAEATAAKNRKNPRHNNFALSIGKIRETLLVFLTV